MNKWMGTGRLTKDPEIRYSNGDNQMCIEAFTLAVDRRFKREGEPTADFIRCKAFAKTAEFIEKYFRKGMKADITGRIQTGSYQKDNGDTVYTTDIIVEEIEFGESKAASQNNSQPEAEPKEEFMNVSDDSDLPFN